jgi:hypothetical protein
MGLRRFRVGMPGEFEFAEVRFNRERVIGAPRSIRVVFND